MATNFHATALDVAKFWSEYFKHLTTLSTGSIVIIATFLEKLFVTPEWKMMVVISLGGFMTSVLSCVIGFMILTVIVDSMDSTSVQERVWRYERIEIGAIVLAMLGFCTGIVFLAIFAIRNLS